MGFGANDALLPRAPSLYSLGAGESLDAERTFSGFGGGGFSRSVKKSGKKIVIQIYLIIR